DNPRSEEPSKIIEQICAGMRRNDKILKIADRKEAIARALDLAKNGEMIAILGKGDETYQEIKGVKYPFSDKQVVSELVAAQGESNLD
ncbi:MAG: glutamate ligase domain-containing protein, partial [Campylobacter sp.]|uniref:glutamate ligase domain-containing protein n=1 Tax=Campylobacter sp. TaxID=205 RepID=UPI003610A2B6